MRRWWVAAAVAAAAAPAAAIGVGGSQTTLCGDGFHADPQASAKACAGAVGEVIRGDYLKNLGSMNLADYRLACCAENQCAPWIESFGGTPRGYEILNPGGNTASGLGLSCADDYEGDPIAVCPVPGGAFAPLRGCMLRALPSKLHPVPANIVAQWVTEHGPKTAAALIWSAKAEIGYFLLLGISAIRVFVSLCARVRECMVAATPSPLGAGNLLYCVALVALATCCAFATWTEIIRFIYEDIDVHGGSSAYWFAHSQVFVRAYIAVTDTVSGWWWSSQLLMFVAPLMLFFRIHSLQHPGMPVLAYALLGFLGAISLATPLFMLEVAMRSRHLTGTDVSQVSVPVMPAYTAGALALAMVCALLLPTAWAIRAEAGVLPYKVLLIAVHDALIVAALPFGWRLQSADRTGRSTGVRSYGVLLFVAAAGAFAAGSHILNTAEVVRELQQSSTAVDSTSVFLTVVSGGFPAANACQASISTDVVGTVVAIALYIMATTAGVSQEAQLSNDSTVNHSTARGVVNALCFCVATPLVSLCGTACVCALLRDSVVATARDPESAKGKSE